MQRGEKGRRLPVEQREWIIVEMEVQEVEFLIVTFLADALQHHHVQRIWVAYRAVKAQRLWPRRIKFGRSAGVAAGEQCDVMSQCDQFFGEPMHHPLGAAIKLGWNSLRQRRDLRDAHLTFSFS